MKSCIKLAFQFIPRNSWLYFLLDNEQVLLIFFFLLSLPSDYFSFLLWNFRDDLRIKTLFFLAIFYDLQLQDKNKKSPQLDATSSSSSRLCLFLSYFLRGVIKTSGVEFVIVSSWTEEIAVFTCRWPNDVITSEGKGNRSGSHSSFVV